MSHNVFDRFRDYLIAQDAAPKTIQAYMADVQQFADWLGARGAIELLEITAQDLRDYRATFDNAAPSTFNRKLVSIKRFTGWAHDEKLMPTDPARQIKSLKQVRPAPRHLTDQDTRALIRAVERFGNPRDKAIVTLMLNTGLRVSEVCSLRWSDIELHDRSGRLIIRGKGNKTREVPLNPAARDVLKEYNASPDPASHVFMGRRNVPLMPRGIGYMLRHYSALAKIEPVNPHALRHRFAYQLRKTQSIEVVARLLGHESITTTAIYTEPTSDDLQMAVDRLN